MDRVAIALGSNVGDRRAHLDYAVTALRGLLTNVAGSYQQHEAEMAARIGAML